MGEHCKACIWQRITSIVYKEVRVSNKKHTTKKRLKSRHFCKDKQMANKHIKRCLISLIMREMQVKIMREHLTLDKKHGFG